MNKNVLIAILVLGLIVVLGSWYLVSSGDGGAATTTPNGTATSTATSSPTSTPSTTTPVAVSRVSFAMLDTAGTTGGKQRGCDRVVLVPFTVATNLTPTQQ